jgi:thymidylate synthase
MTSKTHGYPSIAIKETKTRLYLWGRETKQEEWQSVKSPQDTWELLNHSLSFQIPITKGVLAKEVKPSLPWAEDQFQERVAGVPLNPGNTYMNWPYYTRTSYSDSTHRENHGRFSHTYMERFWPKIVNKRNLAIAKKGENLGDLPAWKTEYNEGIRFKYGDLQDVINLLRDKPTTRQAYLPIWFPEDTGVLEGQRVPCSLGYHFIIRKGFMHMTYYIRSCDYLRHFRDDVYMACRLNQHILEAISDVHPELMPGLFTMHIVSLHVFMNEKELLR